MTNFSYLTKVNFEALKAKNIGRIQAAKGVSVGLSLAYLIMARLSGSLEWIGEISYWPNLLTAATLMYLCSYAYGGQAGTAIIIQKRNAGWIGIICGFSTLITTVFLASWIGFFQEVIPNTGTSSDAFVTYILRPLFIVTIAGFLPVVLVGLWLGNSIKQVSKR